MDNRVASCLFFFHPVFVFLLKQDYSQFTCIYVYIPPCVFAGTFVSVENDIAVLFLIFIKICQYFKHWIYLLSFHKFIIFKLYMSIHVSTFIEKGCWVLLNAFLAPYNWRLLPLFVV